MQTTSSRNARDSEQPDASPPSAARGKRRRRTLPWAVIAGWVLLLLVAVPFAGKLEGAKRDTAVDYLPAGADSTQVARLQEGLPGGDAIDLVLVFHRDGGLTGGDRKAAGERVAEVAAHHDLVGGQAPRAVPSKDGTTLMYPVALTGLTDEKERADAVKDVRAELAAHPEGLRVQVGGPGALRADSQEVFASTDGTLMFATAGVVALLLIITYRSPLLWLVPLGVVGVAAMAAMAIVYGLVEGFDLVVTSMSSSIMTVLVFGAGTDYALLIVSRYREELRRHRAPYDAMREALRGCGPAVLASSGTVAAGLLCLLAADLNSSSGLGPVGAVGVVCALAAMMTLLPAVLVLLGRRVFWPLIPAYGSEPRSTRRGFFEAMGGSARRRPGTVLLGGAALLGVLAIGVLNLPGNLKQEDTFTDKPESVAATETLARAYPDSSSQPISVMARTAGADEALRLARATEGVARADAGRSGGGWTEIDVFPRGAPQSARETATLHALRSGLVRVEDADALVGGPSAQQLDLKDTNARDRMLVIPLVLIAVLLILAALLRSLVAPLVLVVAVVAVWGAAMGLGGLFFEPVFGFAGVDPGLPLLSFVFLVALGVDYGIFLMHRMREESLRGANVPDAAVTALRTTGGVIASAGLVLAATFAVLATLPMVMLVEMGFVVAVGVLLDTFLVRTYLVTSASLLLKRWVWWPGALFRRTAAGPGVPDVPGSPDSSASAGQGGPSGAGSRPEPAVRGG
ncbi:MMPL family transporter [Streptomyces malaysiensis]|uniref:MMPL family transporter n=1 Tax=Streptomyces malaysiensis subsp. samsunensis TaxID=459658 RepID=A0A9X2LQ82_STRMQ|nr:MMPL family transporter [Streptomyces samsunensis]MCQ8827589.1 MMPL family transporter [Streptomyces samsunensis]